MRQKHHNAGRPRGGRFAYLLTAAVIVSLHTAAAAAQPTVQMDIKSFAYANPDLTVAPGTTVVWTNRDETPHTVTSRERVWNSPPLDTDDRFSFTFERVGDYPYYCLLHPQMVGVVHVVAKK